MSIKDTSTIRSIIMPLKNLPIFKPNKNCKESTLSGAYPACRTRESSRIKMNQVLQLVSDLGVTSDLKASDRDS